MEFLLGDIEALPLPDNSVDAAISNCVINLVPDKEKVFSELYRVLRPGGRFMVSDLVLLKELPERVRTSVEAYVGCVAGAILKDQYLAVIRAAGFEDVRIVDESHAAVQVEDQQGHQLTGRRRPSYRRPHAVDRQHQGARCQEGDKLSSRLHAQDFVECRELPRNPGVVLAVNVKRGLPNEGRHTF